MNRRDFVSTVSLGLAAGLPVFAESGLADVVVGSCASAKLHPDVIRLIRQ
jgi:hypothetical protein